MLAPKEPTTAPCFSRRAKLFALPLLLCLAGGALFSDSLLIAARAALRLEPLLDPLPGRSAQELPTAPQAPPQPDNERRVLLPQSSPPPPAPTPPRPKVGNAPPRQPRVYVYDLPASLREPCYWPLTCRLHAAVSASRYRTADPGEADYFWIPHKMPVLGDEELRMLLRVVTNEFPYFNASVAKGVANHIMVFSCDHGPAPCTWTVPPCANAEGLAAWPAEVNPASPHRALLFLGPGGVPDGADTGSLCCQGCFQRGKDVVIPPMMPGRDWDPEGRDVAPLSPFLGPPAAIRDFVRHGTPPRDLQLWFAGAVRPEAYASPGLDATGRGAAFAAFAGRSDAVLLDTRNSAKGERTTSFEAWAPRAVFCLDPMGTQGGWAARSVPALFYGCIPVNTRPRGVHLIFDEHPAFGDWDHLAVHVPSPLGPLFNATFHAALQAASVPAELERRRAGAAAVGRRLVWASVAPPFVRGQAEGTWEGPDALDTLMEVLGARLG